MSVAGRTTHGHRPAGKKSRTYQAWGSMRQRCNNPNTARYARYGGRGIRVCRRWDRFENFLADMGERPEGASIDRINNDGNYTPSNCQWLDHGKNSGKTCLNRLLTFADKTQTIADWARETGITRACITERIDVGWPVDIALTKPMGKYKSRRVVPA